MTDPLEPGPKAFGDPLSLVKDRSARDMAEEDARLYGNGWLRVTSDGRLHYVDPYTIAVLPPRVKR